MFKVYIKDKMVWLDDKPIPLLSGEVHYWRLAPESWEKILKKVKELGLEIVSTYICWQFHEIRPGIYDFTGETDPRRNLKAFLELLSGMEFYIIIRPGPYIYAEWINFGVPERLVCYHRLHPEFKSEASHWIKGVSEFLKPYLATNGGRIILLQVDNEIHPFINFYGEQIGLGNTPGLFQEFLEKRYRNITNLNKLWNTDYANFSEVRAFNDSSKVDCKRIDIVRFLLWYTKEVAKWNEQIYRQCGVDIPLYFNVDAIGVQPWPALEKIGDISAPDYYPTNEFEGRVDEHRHFLFSIRYLSSYSRLPFIAELESGIWHGWHYKTGALNPNHYRLMCLSALLCGAVGWNWYMLVNRDNWYMSPINEWGIERSELFPVFRQLVEIFKKIRPANLKRCCDIGVAIDFLQQAVCNRQEEITSGLYAGGHFLKALYQTGIDFEFFDLNYTECNKPVLFYAGEEWLSYEYQQKILEYIRNGGHFVIIGKQLIKDDNLQEQNIIGVPSLEGIIGYELSPRRISLQLDDKEILTRSPYIYYFREVPGKPITAKFINTTPWFTNLPEGSTYIIGYTQEIEKGRLTFIGVKPEPEIIINLLKVLGVNIYCRCEKEDIHSALFKGDKCYYLIAVNNNDQPTSVCFNINLQIDGRYRVTDLISKKTDIFDSGQQNIIFWHINKKDGIVLEIKAEGE
ncbi:MAG: beta-galactosidase [candidate division WOR-3 bacterium]|nr:beta-galactosidase [candidate division WOR-3 bacterium]